MTVLFTPDGRRARRGHRAHHRGRSDAVHLRRCGSTLWLGGLAGAAGERALEAGVESSVVRVERFGPTG